MKMRGKAIRALLMCWMLLIAAGSVVLSPAAGAAGVETRTHLGVASCSGSTCHGRMVGDGKVVAQDELMRWQEPSTAGGAHSRTYAVLSNARSMIIARNLGIGNPAASPRCLGCHTDNAASRGPRFQIADGVGCEGCHGSASGWIASHYTVGASHAANVSRGMVPLENAKARASICLDCHFGSSREGQFVDHRIMAAGHPRISFELDLFSTLNRHHVEDADYAARKGRSNNLKFWAVGQAMALQRSLTLYASPSRGNEGAFPEFYFFDCHSCHRKIYDQAQPVRTFVENPGRPIPGGMPPYNDENMIMLSAAARVVLPGQAGRFDAGVRAFHAALAQDRGSAVAAARRLADNAEGLASAFAASGMSSHDAFAIIGTIAGDVISPRFTDYEGSVQAVMAIDTLLNALVSNGTVSTGAAASIRADVNRAYAAVRDPNDYRPNDFRAALGSAARSIRTLG